MILSQRIIRYTDLRDEKLWELTIILRKLFIVCVRNNTYNGVQNMDSASQFDSFVLFYCEKTMLIVSKGC